MCCCSFFFQSRLLAYVMRSFPHFVQTMFLLFLLSDMFRAQLINLSHILLTKIQLLLTKIIDWEQRWEKDGERVESHFRNPMLDNKSWKLFEYETFRSLNNIMALNECTIFSRVVYMSFFLNTVGSLRKILRKFLKDWLKTCFTKPKPIQAGSKLW